jgi:hypothetical protein
MRKFVIVGTVLILGIIGVTALALAPILMIGSVFSSTPSPSDDDMIEHFVSNRVDFELLAKMAKEDPRLERLATNFSKPEDPAAAGVDAERLMLYRQLFKQAKIPLGFYNFPDSIVFVFHASGLSVSGSGRAFVYGKAPRAADIVEGDLIEAATGQNRIYLARKIATDWWVTLDRS